MRQGFKLILYHIAELSALFLLCGCGGGASDPPASNPPTGNPPPSPGQAYTVLYTFQGGADGRHPSGGLIRDAAGNLYGTTYTGGTSGFGTVFKLDTAGKETVLHSFTGEADGQGAVPVGLIRDAAGNLYGTTVYGGASGFGMVFKLDAAGRVTMLYSFAGGEQGPDGAYPTGLIRDQAGNLYGTTQYGGTSGIGTVFKLDAAGNYKLLHSFAGDFSGPDGAYPQPGLVRDEAGNLYGTTSSGGSFGQGPGFKVDAAGAETIVLSFAYADGITPQGGLIRDESGNLYGTTAYGGPDDGGTVFRVDANGQMTVLHSFTTNGKGDDPGGYSPINGVLRDAAGNLYGAAGGGVSQWGVIFSLNIESRVYTVLHTFTGKSDGGAPNGALIGANAGNLYGTTFGGGDLRHCPPSPDVATTPGFGVPFRIKLP